MEDKKFVEISPLKQKTKNFDSEFPRGWFPLWYVEHELNKHQKDMRNTIMALK